MNVVHKLYKNGYRKNYNHYTSRIFYNDITIFFSIKNTKKSPKGPADTVKNKKKNRQLAIVARKYYRRRYDA